MVQKHTAGKRTLTCLLAVSLILGLLLPWLGSMEVQAAKGPTLSKKKLVMYTGDTKTLKVKNAKGSVKWSSSKTKIASVSSKGRIKAHKPGKTVITAKVKGKKLTCKLTVKPKLPSLNRKSATLSPGETLGLKLLNAGGTIRWKSSNPRVAEVSKKGKVTAKSTGTAKITASFKKKKYVCSIRVVKKQESTVLTVSFDQTKLETREEKISLSGKIAHDRALADVSYCLLDSEAKVIRQGKLAKADAWSVTLNPAVGTNTLTVSVKDETGRSAENSLTFVRYSKELALNEQVVSGSESDTRDFMEHVSDIQRETPSSDTQKVVIEKESVLAQKLQNHELKQGDTYLLPPDSEYPNGFSGVLQSWGAPSDPSVDASDYIEVSFREPNLDDLFEGDGCVNFSAGVDPDNPVAFLVVPDGSQVSTVSREARKEEDYKQSVFPEGAAGFFKPNVEVKSEGTTSVKLDLADVLLYDRDKKPSTKDQIRLEGSLELSDIKFDGCLEWKDEGISLMPQQIKMGVSYKVKTNVTVKSKASVDFKDLVKEANDNFENKVKKFGVELSGVDMSDRLMLGLIGFNFAVPHTTTIRDVSKQSALSLKPRYFLALYLEISGEISAQVSVAYDYESYRETGFHVCNTKAANISGIHSSMYTEKKQLAGNYVMGTYERERKSKTEYGEPEPKVTLEGKVKGEIKVGAGALCGVMVCGVIPGDFYGGCRGEADFTLDGRAEITKKTTNKLLLNGDLQLTANMKAGFVLGIDLKFAVKIVQSFMKDWGFNLEFSKDKEFLLFEKKLDVPTYKLEGTVYDLTDKTVKEHPVLTDAKLFLYEKDGLEESDEITAEMLRAKPADFEGESDENGNYVIEGMGKRDYILVASAPGYQYYLKKDISFSGKDIQLDVYIEPVREKNWMDVCKPYSYTQTYDEFLGDGNGTMTIGGVKYDAGFYLNNGNQGTGGSSDALWNLKGQFSSLDVRIGHVDDSSKLNATLSVYLDGAQEPSQTIDLNCHEAGRVYTINLDYAESAKFSLKKTQWNNFANSSFGFVEGVWHGKNGTEGTVNFKDPFAGVDWNGSFMQICRPYTGISCTTYDGTTEDRFVMSGESYDTGFVLRTQSITEVWGKSAAMFNTNGMFSALKVRIGHIDASFTENAEIYVYLDGEKEPSQTYTINASDIARVYTIPLNYAKSVKIALQNIHDNWTTEAFGFAEGEWIK